MQVTILGSGTGVPSLARNASGLLIRTEDEKVLFDSGPGIVQRLLEVGITYHDIDYIFYTHFHTDHTLDLATFLFAAKYALSLRTKRLKIVGPQGLLSFYHGLLTLYGDVIRPRDYEIDLQELPIRQNRQQFPSFEVSTLPMQHTPQSLGYRIESQGKSLAYSGDTDVCENIIELGKDADVLITECSFPDEMKARGHLISREAAEIAQRCNCKQLVLTHLYPVCDSYDIAAEARRVFSGQVKIASDLTTFEL